ncbi:hypothetical protein [Mobilicoccus sp.]|uniref:hypothetical protein n=1 Tax=Mobilicoccus sp. TaxID=2034349 RepID=UPI0028B0FB98|nr:hypothetical protein [Mobilicoccus sp.]
MKRMSVIAVPLALALLAGCSGADDAAKEAETSSAPGAAPASPGSTTPAPAAQHTPGQKPGNAEQADVKVTTCEATPSGVEVAVDITNTTKEKRSYILTVLAFDENKKVVASAAVMPAEAIEPGKSGSGEGKSNEAVKGKVTCEVSDIQSMAG